MKMFILTFLFFASSAWGACNYRFSVANATIEILDNAQVVQQNFTLSRDTGNSDCQYYRVFFSKGLGNSYQRKAFTLAGKTIDYNLHKTVNLAGILKEFSDAVSANEYVDGQAADRNTVYTNRFFVAAPGQAGNALQSGTYVDIVQASVYSLGSNGRYDFELSDNFTVLFLVSKKVQLSLVDEGGIFDSNSTSKILDFGILSLNQEKGADLRVLSNGSYQIRISSQNNGQLKLPQGETVSYALRVNGSNVSLTGSAGSPVSIGTGQATSNAGDLYNLKVKITEDPSIKSAGMYQDVLTITAIAN